MIKKKYNLNLKNRKKNNNYKKFNSKNVKHQKIKLNYENFLTPDYITFFTFFKPKRYNKEYIQYKKIKNFFIQKPIKKIILKNSRIHKILNFKYKNKKKHYIKSESRIKKKFYITRRVKFKKLYFKKLKFLYNLNFLINNNIVEKKNRLSNN